MRSGVRVCVCEMGVDRVRSSFDDDPLHLVVKSPRVVGFESSRWFLRWKSLFLLPFDSCFNHASASAGSTRDRLHATDVGTSYAQVGLPVSSQFFARRGFLSSLDYRLRTPLWVAERFASAALSTSPTGAGVNPEQDISSNRVESASRENSQFHTSIHVPLPFRALLSDYAKSGFSRGHLSPAANHRGGSQEQMNETFELSANIVPQELSSNGCEWARLEGAVRGLARMPNVFEVFCVSGPLFLPIQPDPRSPRKYVVYEVIGNNSVAVPTHLYKVQLSSV